MDSETIAKHRKSQNSLRKNRPTNEQCACLNVVVLGLAVKKKTQDNLI